MDLRLRLSKVSTSTQRHKATRYVMNMYVSKKKTHRTWAVCCDLCCWTELCDRSKWFMAKVRQRIRGKSLKSAFWHFSLHILKNGIILGTLLHFNDKNVLFILLSQVWPHYNTKEINQWINHSMSEDLFFIMNHPGKSWIFKDLTKNNPVCGASIFLNINSEFMALCSICVKKAIEKKQKSSSRVYSLSYMNVQKIISHVTINYTQLCRWYD